MEKCLHLCSHFRMDNSLSAISSSDLLNIKNFAINLIYFMNKVIKLNIYSKQDYTHKLSALSALWDKWLQRIRQLKSICPKRWLRMNRNRYCFCALIFTHISFSCSQMIKGTLFPVLWYRNICRVMLSAEDVRSLILSIHVFCLILKYIVIRQGNFSSRSTTKFNKIEPNFIRKHLSHLFYFTLLPRWSTTSTRPLSSWPHSSRPVCNKRTYHIVS